MSSFIRIVACAAVSFCIIGVLARPASACSCVPPPPPEQALEEAEAVFVGMVTRLDQREPHGRLPQVQVTLRVQRSFKGDLGSTVEIHTATSSAACGFSFREGQRYLVYAHPREDGPRGLLATSLCTRTAHLDHAREDLVAFDAVDVIDEEMTDENGGCGGLTNVGALQAFIVVLVAGLWMRRRWA